MTTTNTERPFDLSQRAARAIHYDAEEEAREDDDDDAMVVRSPGSTSHCAGALILLEKIDRPSRMMLLGEQLGIYDKTKLNMRAPVFDTFGAMREAQDS